MNTSKKELLKRIEKIRIANKIDTPKFIFASDKRAEEISEKLDLPNGSIFFVAKIL